MSTEESQPKKSLNIEKKTAIYILGGVAGAILIAGAVTFLMPKPVLLSGKGHAEGHGVESAHAVDSENGSGHGSGHESGHGTDHKVSTPGLITRILLTYGQAIESTEKKLIEMRKLHEDNFQLRAENARLKHQVLTAKYESQKKNSLDAASTATVQVEKQTGSKVGRIIASIAYEVPQNVPYVELFTLGVHYFKGKEDEKAAKIFVFLGDHGGEKFQSVDHAFLTGIALYRIDALDDADRYFDAVLKGPNHASITPIKTQARLWRALIHDKKNHKFKSQFWIRELLDQDPKSEEAAWVSGYTKPVLAPEVETASHEPNHETTTDQVAGHETGHSQDHSQDDVRAPASVQEAEGEETSVSTPEAAKPEVTKTEVIEHHEKPVEHHGH